MNANVMSSMSAVSISATWSAFFKAQTLSSAISAALPGARSPRWANASTKRFSSSSADSPSSSASARMWLSW